MKNRFRDLWLRIGAMTNPETVFGVISDVYSQGHRFYHNLQHIKSCLEEFDNVRHLAVGPDALELAIWFHDIVYDTRGSKNEHRSAEFVSDAGSQAKLTPDFIREVSNLIMATEHNVVCTGSDEKIIADVDLAILGKPIRQFDQYEQDIRAEYSFVSDEHYKNARTSILQGFLDRQTIYATKYFVTKYESQARKNLQRSLIRLHKL